MSGQFRKLDVAMFGPGVQHYVQQIRDAGSNVSIYEHVPTGTIEFIAHNGDSPRPGVLQALADRHLLESATGTKQ